MQGIRHFSSPLDAAVRIGNKFYYCSYLSQIMFIIGLRRTSRRFACECVTANATRDVHVSRCIASHKEVQVANKIGAADLFNYNVM